MIAPFLTAILEKSFIEMLYPPLMRPTSITLLKHPAFNRLLHTLKLLMSKYFTGIAAAFKWKIDKNLLRENAYNLHSTKLFLKYWYVLRVNSPFLRKLFFVNFFKKYLLQRSGKLFTVHFGLAEKQKGLMDRQALKLVLDNIYFCYMQG